ncbi:uncharacterized protein LOC119662287 [Teleopsis dalmanni]|uniref:uncharacterized protein LOC119662287 n=1 Tax=Teleopsis dalmanni TaxID=139649 RepID=UPI0018CCFE6B|nr:uncharacterized protein LOC119662287 [Teleopsis dalmanni]XP_037927807.1 uncharacterized protein LOC119662287 [Teleopsis dalmanni]
MNRDRTTKTKTKKHNSPAGDRAGPCSSNRIMDSYTDDLYPTTVQHRPEHVFLYWLTVGIGMSIYLVCVTFLAPAESPKWTTTCITSGILCFTALLYFSEVKSRADNINRVGFLQHLLTVIGQSTLVGIGWIVFVKVVEVTSDSVNKQQRPLFRNRETSWREDSLFHYLAYICMVVACLGLCVPRQKISDVKIFVMNLLNRFWQWIQNSMGFSKVDKNEEESANTPYNQKMIRSAEREIKKQEREKNNKKKVKKQQKKKT